MIQPVVVGSPVAADVLLVGQAPGVHEGPAGKPFAWTAGKTLFTWLGSIGTDETTFRSRAYMAAVCRCFPGKKGGADRPPSDEEIARCAPWLDEEVKLLSPKLVLPVGKMAIAAILGDEIPLAECVGQKFSATRAGKKFDAIPLPHPSGASTWFRMEPGKTLLAKALKLIATHPAWKSVTLD